jgi:hypothetical protein
MMIVGLCDTSGNKTSYSSITTLKFIVLSGQVYSKMIFRPVVEAQLFLMLGEYSYLFFIGLSHEINTGDGLVEGIQRRYKIKSKDDVVCDISMTG